MAGESTAAARAGGGRAQERTGRAPRWGGGRARERSCWPTGSGGIGAAQRPKGASSGRASRWF